MKTRTSAEVWQDRRERWAAFNAGQEDRRIYGKPLRADKYSTLVLSKAYNEGWGKVSERLTREGR